MARRELRREMRVVDSLIPKAEEVVAVVGGKVMVAKNGLVTG